MTEQYIFPARGLPKDQILQTMRAARANDVKWHEGKVFSLSRSKFTLTVVPN